MAAVHTMNESKGSNMDPTELPALHHLPPGDASACIMSHLTRYDRQQFALSCKHAQRLAAAAVTRLSVHHKSFLGKPCATTLPSRTVFQHCSCVSVKPRTVEELTKLITELLLHKQKQLPLLNELRVDLQGVYDKQCDLSLIVKSIPLHVRQLSSVYVQQEAQVSVKAMAAIAELPLLTSLAFKTAVGFEPGALGKLEAVSNLMSLHLEVTAGGPVFAAAPLSNSAMTPVELARLLTSDEVALSKCTQITSLTAINLGGGGFACHHGSSFRPVEALLQAAAESYMMRLSRVVLDNMQQLPARILDLLAAICSLSVVSLTGCDSVCGSTDIAKLSVLTGLTQLVLGSQPPTSVLSALAKGCKLLQRVIVGVTALQPAAAISMPNVTDLQLLGNTQAHLPRPTSNTNSSTYSMANGSAAPRARIQAALTGLGKMWPNITSLQVSGVQLDAAGVTEIQQLQGLTSLKLTGTSGPAGPVLQARQIMPLLDMPKLQLVVLLEMTGLTDDWIADAVSNTASSKGRLSSVRELHLGAAAIPTAVPATGSTAKAAGVGVSAPAVTAGGSSISSSQALTDKGLVRLLACPRLHKVVLVGLHGLTLAGVKALVKGNSSLRVIEMRQCSAVSAAPPDVIARAAVVAPDRAVDLWVS